LGGVQQELKSTKTVSKDEIWHYIKDPGHRLVATKKGKMGSRTNLGCREKEFPNNMYRAH